MYIHTYRSNQYLATTVWGRDGVTSATVRRVEPPLNTPVSQLCGKEGHYITTRCNRCAVQQQESVVYFCFIITLIKVRVGKNCL